MTNFIKLAENFYIYGQIDRSHISRASSDGIKTIINLRPDGEKPGYINADNAAELADDENINYHHIPVAMTGPSPEQVKEFGDLLENCEDPILAHCGSGKRAAILWALSNKDKLSADEIIKSCADCGHDLSKLRPHLSG